jgi:hypothetical protein
LASFAVAAYAVTRVFDQGGLVAILAWFAGCVVVHDLVGWPGYALADRWLLGLSRRAGRRRARSPQGRRVPWVNHVRAPTVVSGVLLLISFPLVLRRSNAYYQGVTGFSEDVYLRNWLGVTGVAFAASALAYALRLARVRRPAGRGRSAGAVSRAGRPGRHAPGD